MIKFAVIKIQNPVFIASGIAGTGEEYFKFTDLNRLGGFITKTITMNPKPGNQPPRIVETESGMINTIGIENPGLTKFINDKLPAIKKQFKIPVIVSISGETEKDYTELIRELNKYPDIIKGIELNLSCPNVKYKVKCFAQSPEMTYAIVRCAKKAGNLPVIAKLTPNVSDIAEIAASAEKAGADAVSLINTVTGLAFLKSGQIITGGLSGPCIKPIALRCVHEVAKSTKLEIMGVGGITSYSDVIEFFAVGAKTVAIGSSLFNNPSLINQILQKNP